MALIGGGLGVWLAKSAFPNAWVAAIFAAGVVLALTVYYLLNDEDAPEEEGDNVYYLGLLFTLISLMFVLVELFGAESKGVANAEKIRTLLENFGIALTSTVMGIAGRVAVQNWQLTGSARTISDRLNWTRRSDQNRDQRIDPEAQPEFPTGEVVPTPRTNADLQELEAFNRHLLGRIARELTQGANALARFHRIVRAHASDTEEQLQNHSEALQRRSILFRDTLQRNTNTFAQDLKRLTESTLSTVATAFVERANQAEGLIEKLRAAQEKQLAETSEANRAYGVQIDKLSGQSLEALQRNFSLAAQQAEALPEKIKAAHDGFLAEVRESTRALRDEIRIASDGSLGALQNSLTVAADQSKSLGQNVSELDARVQRAFENLETSLGRAMTASSSFGESVQGAANSTKTLESEIDRLLRAHPLIQTGTETIAATFDALSKLNTKIEADRDSEQAVALARESADALRTIASQGVAVTEQAAKTVELFDALGERIQATENEARHARKALRSLADEAQAQTKALRERQRSRFAFWRRD